MPWPRRGVRCTSGYVSAPYCSPSRAGFLTGRYQTRFGHEFNPHQGDETKLGLPLDQRTIADYLHTAGYATGLVGKWHQGFSPQHHPQSRGFSDYFGFLVGGHNFILRKDAEPRFGSAHSHDMIYRGAGAAKTRRLYDRLVYRRSTGLHRPPCEDAVVSVFGLQRRPHAAGNLAEIRRSRAGIGHRSRATRLSLAADWPGRLDWATDRAPQRIGPRQGHAHFFPERQWRLRPQAVSGLQHGHQYAAAGRQGADAGGRHSRAVPCLVARPFAGWKDL